MELESGDELWAKSMPQRDAMDGSGDEAVNQENCSRLHLRLLIS